MLFALNLIQRNRLHFHSNILQSGRRAIRNHIEQNKRWFEDNTSYIELFRVYLELRKEQKRKSQSKDLENQFWLKVLVLSIELYWRKLETE